MVWVVANPAEATVVTLAAVVSFAFHLQCPRDLS